MGVGGCKKRCEVSYFSLVPLACQTVIFSSPTTSPGSYLLLSHYCRRVVFFCTTTTPNSYLFLSHYNAKQLPSLVPLQHQTVNFSCPIVLIFSKPTTAPDSSLSLSLSPRPSSHPLPPTHPPPPTITISLIVYSF